MPPEIYGLLSLVAHFIRYVIAIKGNGDLCDQLRWATTANEFRVKKALLVLKDVRLANNVT